MLTFFNGGAARYCDGLSRRSFLKAGSLALGGLAMPAFLRLKAHGAVSSAPSLNSRTSLRRAYQRSKMAMTTAAATSVM